MNKLTEALIVAWLRDQIATLGVKGLQLSVNTEGSTITASLPVFGSYTHDYGFADTIAEAVEKLQSTHKTPAQLAAELRAKADAIEREAHL